MDTKIDIYENMTRETWMGDIENKKQVRIIILIKSGRQVSDIENRRM